MKSLKNFKKNEWNYHGLWEQMLFPSYFWIHWKETDFLRSLGIRPCGDETIIAKGHYFIFKKDLAYVGRQLLAKIKRRDERFIRKFISLTDVGIKKSESQVQKLASSIVSASTFKLFIEANLRVMTPWCLCAIWSEFIEKEARELSGRFELAWENLVDFAPPKETPLIRQHNEALEILALLKKRGFDAKKAISLKRLKADRILWDRISKHIAKYTWLGILNFTGEPITAEKFLQSLPSLQKVPKRRFGGKRIPKNIQYLARFIRAIGYGREISAEYSAKLAYESFGYLQKVARHLKISYQDLLYLSPEEILAVLQGRILDIGALLARRKTGYCIFHHKKSDIIIDEKREVINFIERNTPKGKKGVTMLAGVVANKGKAVGKVKIVISPSEFEKFTDGDILVTTMTTPDFAVLMQRSSAIVTDIGGMLSHAAIVSRELGKPCIIGTKIATKVFRDGDLVEVDADKGTIKKI